MIIFFGIFIIATIAYIVFRLLMRKIEMKVKVYKPE